MEKSIDEYIKELLSYKMRSTNPLQHENTVTSPNTENSADSITGNLIVTVTHSKNTFPIENARVEVYDKNNNLIATHFTNSSGQTPYIPLPTVTKENSEESDYTGAVAVNYDIVITADGYVTTRIENIPVFQGVTTSQPIDMTFLAASNTGDNQTIILSNSDRG